MSTDVIVAFAISVGVLCITVVGVALRARNTACHSEQSSGRPARVLVLVMIPIALLVLAAVVLGIALL
jgi:hypothetical protein